MKITKLFLASNNDKKLREFKEIFSEYKVEIICPKDLSVKIDPEENGKTFFENAKIKAEAFLEYVDCPIISDDSGLIIDALGKDKPGIESHRYIESFESREKCLSYCVEHFLNSTARFHTSLVLLNLEKDPLEFIGEVEGHIVPIRKMNDFGYDPIFKVDSLNKTFSELTLEEKDKVSHRGLAAKNLLEYLLENKYIAK